MNIKLESVEKQQQLYCNLSVGELFRYPCAEFSSGTPLIFLVTKKGPLNLRDGTFWTVAANQKVILMDGELVVKDHISS